MKMLLILALLPSFSWALTPLEDSHVTALVPKGRVVERFGKDFHVKTEAGTKIRMEFMRDGNLEEASGMNLSQGDIFEPGQGLISLSSAARALKEVQKKAKILGQWNLEKDSMLGWIYTFRTEVEAEETEYLVDAKSGAIVQDPGLNAQVAPYSH